MPPVPEPKSKAAVPQGKRDVGRRPPEQVKTATPALSLLPMKEQLQKSVLLQKPKKGDSKSEPHCKDDLAAAAAAADDDWVLEDLVEKEEEDEDNDDEDWFFEVPLMEEEDWVTVTPDSRDGKWA
ncbi:uncharacterized protein B0T23DRAFT_426921 [Neurospora hispaniola]|uniref:Uncharacterized protein n=1 Tax=Neurospora hispaniola TaxID=588809 RepID=A0AAJ0IDV0_9PEZI|nr:hypothetical protein B0T23DRAFT_426921 [Neurospora hispaniola]